MSPADITVSMADFVKDYLPKIAFSLERIENMAMRNIIYPQNDTLTVVWDDSFVHIPPDSIREYFGQRLHSKPEETEPEKMEKPGEDFVSRDPQGIEDIPPETYTPKRRPGRPRKT